MIYRNRYGDYVGVGGRNGIDIEYNKFIISRSCCVGVCFIVFGYLIRDNLIIIKLDFDYSRGIW